MKLYRRACIHALMRWRSIEGDYVPTAGDVVQYKRCAVPPKRITFSAVHVQIVQLNAAVKHDKWTKDSTDESSSRLDS